MHTFVLAAVLAAAPTGTQGDLTGTVRGAEGRPLAEVRVEVVEVHRHATTSREGTYRISGLPNGTYTISFALIGYRPEIRRVVVGDGRTTLDLTMSVSIVEIPILQVTGSALATSALESPQPLSVLNAEALRTANRPTLGETLAQEPGLRNLSTGNGIGKPVIRGLTSNRVLVLADGQRLETQQWGDEHGPNVETADAERIEVIRGPASVLYGSDALGGVINVVERPLPDAIDRNPFALWSLKSGFGTNGSAPEGTLGLEGATGAVGFRGSFSARRAGNIETPTGDLSNSGYRSFGGDATVGTRGTWGDASLHYAHRNERIEIHEDPAEEPDFSGFQRIRDDRLRAELNLPVRGGSRLEVNAGFQRNFRREFEADDEPDPALVLDAETWTGDVRLRHSIGPAAGTIGVSAIRSTLDKGGEEDLVPGSATNGIGIFAFEQLPTGPWILSAGIRADHRRLTVDDDAGLGVTAQAQSWNSVTGTLGALVRVSDPVALVLNVGRGFRAPSVFELFSNGVHEGTSRFEIGSPDLSNETSTNVDLAVRVQSGRLRAELGGFVNRITDFIFPDPTGTFDAESGFEIFDIAQTDATLIGFEAAAEYHPTSWLHLRGGSDFVRGEDTDRDQPLPFMPPLRVTYGARVEAARQGRAVRDLYLDLGGETNTRQTRLDPQDFAPDGYTLASLGTGAVVGVGDAEVHVDVSVRNLFDKTYTNFMSRFKRFAIDQGRNVVFQMSTHF